MIFLNLLIWHNNHWFLQQGGDGANGRTESSGNEGKKTEKQEHGDSIESEVDPVDQSGRVEADQSPKVEQLTSNQGEIALNVNMREQVLLHDDILDGAGSTGRPTVHLTRCVTS